MPPVTVLVSLPVTVMANVKLKSPHFRLRCLWWFMHTQRQSAKSALKGLQGVGIRQCLLTQTCRRLWKANGSWSYWNKAICQSVTLTHQKWATVGQCFEWHSPYISLYWLKYCMGVASNMRSTYVIWKYLDQHFLVLIDHYNYDMHRLRIKPLLLPQCPGFYCIAVWLVSISGWENGNSKICYNHGNRWKNSIITETF